MIIGLDPAMTATGVAIMKDDQLVEAFTIRSDKASGDILRLKEMTQEIISELRQELSDPEVRVVIELPPYAWQYMPREVVKRHHRVRGYNTLIGLCFHLAIEFSRLGVILEGVPALDIKRLATGSTQASKSDMVAVTRTKFPEFSGDHHAADAVWAAVGAYKGIKGHRKYWGRDGR